MITTAIISEATEKEYKIIQKIAHKTWPATFGNILSNEQIDYMLEIMYSICSLTQQVDEKKHKFILVKKTDYLGFASYQTSYDGAQKTKIHKIYILPEAQGKGIGNLLMNEIGKIAKQNNNKILSLSVNRDNRAIQFYMKLGFNTTGQENLEIGNGFIMENFILEKNL